MLENTHSPGELGLCCGEQGTWNSGEAAEGKGL